MCFVIFKKGRGDFMISFYEKLNGFQPYLLCLKLLFNISKIIEDAMTKFDWILSVLLLLH